MANEKLETEPSGKSIVRVSVSLPRDLHAELENMARARKVSLAWVLRDAAERYIAENWPLLPRE